jgi:hypothetical protein
MAIYQHTPTVNATRPGLRSVTGPGSGPDRASLLPGRLTATVAGAAAVLVGAWAGLVPYVGHALHYSADGSATWTWNLQHGLLSLLPGAMAVGGGVLLLAVAWVRRERTSARVSAALAGVTALLGLSAVWLLIGAWVWPIYFTGHLLATASPVRTFANVLGFYLAEGFVLAAIAGVAGTWAVRSVPRRWRPVIG